MKHDKLDFIEISFDCEGQVTYVDTFWHNGDYNVIEHCRSFELFYLLDPETYSWEAMWDEPIQEYYRKLKDN